MVASRLLENTFAHPGLGALFQRAPFFELHAQGRGVFFEWEKGGHVVASVHFTPMGSGLWRSPARGTYAGFATAPGLHTDALFEFHDAVVARLGALGARRIEVLPAPMAHDPIAFSNQAYLFHARGYSVTQCDLNHSLAVDAQPFEARMSYGNVKRLRKCRKEGIEAGTLPPEALPEVYAVLAANRASKGHAMSMTLSQLQDMQARFPESMALFGCRAGAELAASALCLRVQPHVLYVFYWGDRPGYATLSPVVSVADAIYSYCQAEGIAQIDAGTSTIDREANHGLIQFKRGLGFSESLKVRMARDV
ncbi:GNAT family N-acetyltransferase [Aquincola sp. MAHUQ-54]|uniref:GNAT family N-acetyltransferase n=1 Tax=Aquincola agrisoli TaxID=3119538 RepID=A0AAW9QA56_9BURK